MTDQELASAYTDELLRIGNARFDINLPLLQLVSLIAAAQLGLRHPDVATQSANVVTNAQEFIDKIVVNMRRDGLVAIAEVIERGNKPAFDIPRKR